MNNIIKQVIIIISCFLLILWFQEIDDKKSKRVRTSMFDQYKVPLIVSSIVGLFLNLNLNADIFNQLFCKDINLTPQNVITQNITPENVIPENPINLNNINRDIIKPIARQDIYTEMPPF